MGRKGGMGRGVRGEGGGGKGQLKEGEKKGRRQHGAGKITPKGQRDAGKSGGRRPCVHY